MPNFSMPIAKVSYRKKEQIQIILNGLGDNTVSGLSETWLKESIDQKLRELNKDCFE